MSALTAIIVNYNAGDELAASLRSVAGECAGLEWEAIVVDNASTDDSVAAAVNAPRVTLVRNDVNVGFSRAVNQALALSAAPLILLINPDCELKDGALAELRAVLDADQSCAIAGPRILDPDGGVQGSARGDPDMLTGVFGRTGGLRALLPSVSAARRNVVVEDALAGGAESKIVDWVSGACMLIRAAPLRAVGGFDDRYFLYWEDADVCRRLRQNGYRIRYVPAAVAVHVVGRSSRTAQAASVRAFHASAYRYYATHVARHVWDPRRIMARVLLSARCWVKLRSAGGS